MDDDEGYIRLYGLKSSWWSIYFLYCGLRITFCFNIALQIILRSYEIQIRWRLWIAKAFRNKSIHPWNKSKTIRPGSVSVASHLSGNFALLIVKNYTTTERNRLRVKKNVKCFGVNTCPAADGYILGDYIICLQMNPSMVFMCGWMALETINQGDRLVHITHTINRWW